MNEETLLFLRLILGAQSLIVGMIGIFFLWVKHQSKEIKEIRSVLDGSKFARLFGDLNSIQNKYTEIQKKIPVKCTEIERIEKIEAEIESIKGADKRQTDRLVTIEKIVRRIALRTGTELDSDLMERQ